jgi:hypothetical protein
MHGGRPKPGRAASHAGRQHVHLQLLSLVVVFGSIEKITRAAKRRRGGGWCCNLWLCKAWFGWQGSTRVCGFVVIWFVVILSEEAAATCCA